MEELYPGVPLYTRSSVRLPTRRTFLTKVQRRLLTIANKEKKTQSDNLSILSGRFFESPEHLQTNWNAILLAVNRYIDTKGQMNNISNSSTGEGPSAGAPDDNFLWSLNLVSQKVCKSWLILHNELFLFFKSFYFRSQLLLFLVY